MLLLLYICRQCFCCCLFGRFRLLTLNTLGKLYNTFSIKCLLNAVKYFKVPACHCSCWQSRPAATSVSHFTLPPTPHTLLGMPPAFGASAAASAAAVGRLGKFAIFCTIRFTCLARARCHLVASLPLLPPLLLLLLPPLSTSLAAASPASSLH